MLFGEGGLLVGEGEISLCGFSYYVMHHVILVLVLLMLRWHEVFRASTYMMKTAYCRNISTLLSRPCLYRSAIYCHWYHRAFARAPVQSLCDATPLHLWNNIGIRCFERAVGYLVEATFLAGKYYSLMCVVDLRSGPGAVAGVTMFV